MRFFRRKFFTWAFMLIMCLVVVIIAWVKFPELVESFRRLGAVRPLPVLFAIVACCASLAAMGEVTRVFMKAGHVRVRFRDIFALTLSANAWSTTLPGGPAFATALQYHMLSGWGAGPAITSWFIVLSGAISTLWLVALGVLAIIAFGASLSLWSLVGSLALLTALSVLVYSASRRPVLLRRYGTRLLTAWNSFRHQPKDRGVRTLNAHITQLARTKLSLSNFAWASLCSLLNWLFDILTLWFCVWAVTDDTPNLRLSATIVMAYATGKIAGLVQVTPGGLGPVEAGMIAPLVAVGSMTAVNAFAAVLCYRLISFILMSALGWIVYAWVYARRGITSRKLRAKKSSLPEN